MQSKFFPIVSATIAAITALSPSVSAQTTWNGSVDGSWATSGNWSAGVPDAADLVTYGAGSGVGTAVANGIQTLDAAGAVLGFSVGNNAVSPITINSGGAGTNPLTIGTSGILLNSGTGGSFTSNADIIMAGAQSFTTGTARSITVNNVANGGFFLTVNTAGTTSTTAINGLLSGAGGLTKSGPGALTVSGTGNTFSGQVTVSGGTLNITKLATLGSSSSIGTGNTASSIVLNGGTLAYTGAGGDTTDRAIDMRSGAVINNNSTTGPISFTAANVIQGGTTSARTLSLGGSNSGDNTFNSILGDSGTGANISSLQKNGTGKWIVTGTQLYTGATIINAGTLSVSGVTVLGGAAASTVDAGNIVFGQNLNSGKLEFQTVANLGASDQIRFRNTGGTAGQGGGMVYVGTTAQTISKAIQCDTSVGVRLSSDSVGGRIEFSGSWAGVNPGASANGRPIYLEGTGTGNNTISGSINANGNGTLTKRDSGTWVLSGNNTYTGSTNINGGTLIAGSAGALANSPVNLAGGTLASTVNGTVTTTGTLSLSGGVTSKIDFGGGTTVLSFANSSAATWTGTLQIWNWMGNLSGGGADQLIFASAGLDATKISQVTFVDPNGIPGNLGAQFVGNELVPVPEPSPLMVGLGLVGLALYRRSRV